MENVKKRINELASKFNSPIDELNFQIGNITYEINDDVLQGWYEYERFNVLILPTGEATLIKYNGFETYSEYKNYLKDLTGRLNTQLKANIAERSSYAEKLTYINELLQTYKKRLVDLGYPIDKDFFGNYIMKSPIEVPYQYKLDDDFIEDNKLEEEAVYEIENNCFEHYTRIKFNALSEIIAQLYIAQDILDKTSKKINQISEQEKVDDTKLDSTIESEKGNSFENELKVPVRNKATALTINQTALLIEYLKRFDIILPLSNNKIGKLMGELTGFSAQNLRVPLGNNQMIFILNDDSSMRPPKLSHQENANFIRLISVLRLIIEHLENQMEKNKSK